MKEFSWKLHRNYFWITWTSVSTQANNMKILTKTEASPSCPSLTLQALQTKNSLTNWSEMRPKSSFWHRHLIRKQRCVVLHQSSASCPCWTERNKTSWDDSANNCLSDLATSLCSRLIICQMEGARDELQNGEMWESGKTSRTHNHTSLVIGKLARRYQRAGNWQSVGVFSSQKCG